MYEMYVCMKIIIPPGIENFEAHTVHRNRIYVSVYRRVGLEYLKSNLVGKIF